MPGCPIRKSTDQIVCADPRSLSQLITSFVASESLGIHRLPLSVFAPNVPRYCYRKYAGCILTYYICSTLFSRLFLSSMSMIASEGSAEAFTFCCLNQERLALKEVHHSRGFLFNPSQLACFPSGSPFLVCGCKDRAKYKYQPNHTAKYFIHTPDELTSLALKLDTYKG